MLKALAREPGFYGLLAADQLGLAAAPHWEGWKPAEATSSGCAPAPASSAPWRSTASTSTTRRFREWVWAIRGLDDKDLLAAAELARRAREPDRAINTAERTLHVHDFAQRYPHAPPRGALRGGAAVSTWTRPGSTGSSARRAASCRCALARGRHRAHAAHARHRALGGPADPVPAFQPAMLAQPEVNAQMGAYYFKRVLGNLGDPVLATAAYNAGPGRARRWRDAQPLDGAIYAETIPFNETRDYVKKVVANAWFYTHRLTGKVPSMRALVGTVPGRSGDGADAAAVASISLRAPWRSAVSACWAPPASSAARSPRASTSRASRARDHAPAHAGERALVLPTIDLRVADPTTRRRSRAPSTAWTRS